MTKSSSLLNHFERAYYEISFELQYLKKDGNEFQNFFAEIMEKAHRGDFQRVRPWGSAGDRKNDGYLKSERMLFQVYAPNEMTAKAAIKKIKDDFHGALPYWRDYFDCWIFVHNSRRGLGPGVVKTLLDLGKANKPLTLNQWGYEELRGKVFSMPHLDIKSLLGPAPSTADLANVDFQDLQVVLLAIGQNHVVADVPIRPVPADKISANALSESTQILLKAGMMKSGLVKMFFEQYHDPGLGDRIARAFKKKYMALKRLKKSADHIFQDLMVFAGGANRGSPGHEAAVLAILAHLFEECDIFERARKR